MGVSMLVVERGLTRITVARQNAAILLSHKPLLRAHDRLIPD